MRSGILHIGLPKTGTTSFQNALFEHRVALLSDFRIFYPSIDPNLSHALCMMFKDDPRNTPIARVNGANTLEKAMTLRESFCHDLEKDFESSDWDTIIISAEGLSTLSAAEYNRLKNWLNRYTDNWKVFISSRHPVDYTTSVMQELVKLGMTLDTMLRNLPLPNFRIKVENAAAAFGQEAVFLTAYEDALQEPGGIVAAFCRRIGLEEPVAQCIAASAGHYNESMSMLATQLLDSLNVQRPLLVDGQRQPKASALEVHWISRIRGPKFRLPPETRQAIKIQSRADVDWLNSAFGTSHYSDVFESGDAAEIARPEGVLPGETIDSLALTLSDLLEQTRVMQETLAGDEAPARGRKKKRGLRRLFAHIVQGTQ
jgi:hypothetical protein